MKRSPEEIEAQLNAIRLDYLASLAGKRDILIASCATLRDDWDPQIYDDLYHLLHTLAGSAETFGLAEVTADARCLLNRLRQHVSDNTLGVDTFRELDNAISGLLDNINTSLQELDNLDKKRG